MPKLQAVLSGSRTIPVEFDSGVTLHVTYDPNEYTPESEERWNEMAKVGEAALAADFICSIVKDWDLEEDDSDAKVKLIPDRVKKLSLMFLDQIITAIGEDVRDLGEAKKNRAGRRAKK